MLLPEDNVLLGPVQRPPGADASLQRAADTGADLGMAAPDLVENGHRPQAWGALQQRHYLAVPNLSQRISTSAATRRLLLRRQPWILFETIGGGGAEPGFGRGNARRLGSAETHIQPHLAVGDVAAGQAAVPHSREEPTSYRPTATPGNTAPCGAAPVARFATPSGYALPSSRIRRHFLIPIDALFSSCLPRRNLAIHVVGSCITSLDCEAFAALLAPTARSEEHTSELQSLAYLVCRLLLEKKKKKK